MSVQVCWNCHKETEVAAPDYRCTFCQTPLTAEVETKVYQNEVIVPKGLSELREKPSIKATINLLKPPLPWEIEQPKPEPKIETPPVQEEKIMPIEEKETPASEQKDPLPKEEKMPFIDIPIHRSNPEPIDNHTFVYTPPEVEKQPDYVIEEKTQMIPPPPTDFSMTDLLREMEEKDKKLREFLEEEPKNEKPVIEPDELDWRKMLREAEEKERKAMGFLEDKPVVEPESKPNPKPEKESVIEAIPEAESEKRENPAIHLPKIENKNPEKQGKPVVGWLILHTENTEPVYYELFDGDNVIGRADNINPVDVELKNDLHASRGHAVLRVFSVPPDIYVYELRDDGSKRADKSPSLNGTYLNGNAARLTPSDRMYLQEDNTIQIGLTKLVFKAKRNSNIKPEDAAGEVFTKGYTQTVQFNR